MVNTIPRTEDQVGLNTKRLHNSKKKPTICRTKQISQHIRDTVLKESGGICQCANLKHKKGSCNNMLIEGHYYFYGSGDSPSSYRVICRRCRDRIATLKSKPKGRNSQRPLTCPNSNNTCLLLTTSLLALSGFL